MSTPTHDAGKKFGTNKAYAEGWDRVFLKSADEWLATPKYQHFTVMDPDGWDRQNFDESWAEKITEQEFFRRLNQSTCMVKVHDWKN